MRKSVKLGKLLIALELSIFNYDFGQNLSQIRDI